VPRVNAEVDNVHALLLDVNVIQTSVEIVGLGNLTNTIALNLMLCLFGFRITCLDSITSPDLGSHYSLVIFLPQ
jgi:hypothetical protein